MKKICLLIIDPQKDLCDKFGALFIPGADKDVDRIVSMIYNLSDKISNIYVSLNSHKFDSVFHECWFINNNGESPQPFEIIYAQDLKSGKWNTTFEDTYNYTLEYIQEIEKNGKNLMIWPYYCLAPYQDFYIGEQDGASVVSPISEALHFFSNGNNGDIHYITKGGNRFTEQFSIFKPELPCDSSFNHGLLEELEEYDLILVSGGISSHSVINSLLDMYSNFKDPISSEKVILLVNTISPMALEFKKHQQEVIKLLKSAGMKTKKTTSMVKYINSTWDK